MPALHVQIACVLCRSRQRRSYPLESLDVTMPQAGGCVAVGLENGCLWYHLVLSVEGHWYIRPEFALDMT